MTNYLTFFFLHLDFGCEVLVLHAHLGQLLLDLPQLLQVSPTSLICTVAYVTDGGDATRARYSIDL